MTVYLDVLFLINSGMNFLILTLLSVVFGYEGKIKRRILGSLLGGGFACLSFVIWPYQRGIGQIFLSFLISGFMLFITYGTCNFLGFLKRFFCLYLIVYGLGGALTWVLRETKGGYYLLLLMRTTEIRNLYFKSFFLISLGVFLLLVLLFGTGKMAKEEQQFLYPVTIVVAGKTIHTIGLLDTGNRLREPSTKKAVLVIEFESIYQALDENLVTWLRRYFAQVSMKEEETPKEIYWIPFSSVGKKEGKLPAIVCDNIFLSKKTDKEKNELFLAITNQKLSPTGEYFLLLHADLWKKT